jgi:hypothetical protein
VLRRFSDDGLLTGAFDADVIRSRCPDAGQVSEPEPRCPPSAGASKAQYYHSRP